METKFNLAADTENQVTVDSSIIFAVWKSGVAPLGGEAHLEIGTSFVGFDAPVEITAKTDKGKNVGSISDKMRNNKFVGRFTIPEDLKVGDLVYFKFKLPRHGLEMESNRIPVVPPIIVSDLSWSATEARRGDQLTLKAKVKNVADSIPATITIYEHDQDGAHDKIAEIQTQVFNERIELQWEYRYFEDTDEIPTEQELAEYGNHYNPPEYFFTVKIEDQEFGRAQESGLLLFKDWIEIQLLNDEGEPVPNQKYKLTLADGSTREGELDSEGKVRLEDIPPGSITVTYPGAVPAVEQSQISETGDGSAVSDPELDVADKSEIDQAPAGEELPEGTHSITDDPNADRTSDQAHSAALAASLEDSGRARPQGHAAHHIVATGHPDCEEARIILEEAGIGIDDAENGVWLPDTARAGQTSPGLQTDAATSHSDLHTSRYFSEVTDRLRRAQEADRVREELELIAGELELGTFPH